MSSVNEVILVGNLGVFDEIFALRCSYAAPLREVVPNVMLHAPAERLGRPRETKIVELACEYASQVWQMYGSRSSRRSPVDEERWRDRIRFRWWFGIKKSSRKPNY